MRAHSPYNFKSRDVSLQMTISNLTKVIQQVENTAGKGEIARYEQFLLFPQCFQKDYFPGASKGVFVWEWVKNDLVKVVHNHKICILFCSRRHDLLS